MNRTFSRRNFIQNLTIGVLLCTTIGLFVQTQVYNLGQTPSAYFSQLIGVDADVFAQQNPSSAAIRKGILTSTIQKQMLDRMETTGLTSAKKLESLGNSNYTNADKFKETFHSYDESIKELGISSPQCPPTRSSDQLL